MTLYLFVLRLQKIAVTATNKFFDEDLAIVPQAKQFLLYNCKKTFRYVAELELRSFYGYKVSKYPSCRGYKNFALKNATKI